MIVYGLITAAQLIQSGGIRRVLVIGAETLSRLLDWEDSRTCVLVGDGAGAAWARTAQKSPDPRPRRIALGLAPDRNARSRPGTARSLLVRPQY
jgi:3-oxoacyl-[acyl-carrier-protein] synthase III